MGKICIVSNSAYQSPQFRQKSGLLFKTYNSDTKKTGGMDTKSWESIPPESYVIYINLPVPVLHRQSDLQYSQFQD